MAGNCYKIQVGGFSGDQGSGVINVELAGGEGNDNCADAEEIFNGTTEFDNFGATDDGPVPCGIIGSDIWYNYNATFTGELVIETCGSGFDTALAAYDGCECPADEDNLLACNDDFCGLQSTIQIPVVAGNCYKIQVGGFAGEEGSGVITISKIAATGACCFTDGSCAELTEEDCNNQGGEFQGANTDCGGAFIYTIEECDSDFEDISGTGNEATNASNSDDDGDIVPIGFTFNYFGDDHDTIGIASNGYLTFGNTLNDFTNDDIPDDAEPNDAIFPLWDDWSPNQGGTVHYETVGEPGQRRFIAQWTGVPHFGGDCCSTFQAVLFERTNCIEFRYGEFVNVSPSVGLENQDGTAGFSIDPDTLFPGACVLFCPVETQNPCEQKEPDCGDFPCGNNDQKVLLCHVPPGNPENEHTLCISLNAVDAHLENHKGDHCGPCEEGVGNPR